MKPRELDIPFHRRLVFRSSVRLAVLLTLAGVGLLAFDRMVVERREIGELKHRSTLLSDAFVRHMTKVMLNGEPQQMHGVAQFVGAQSDVASIEVLGADAVVRFSSDPARVGAAVDPDDDECLACHRDGSLPTTGVMVTSRDGTPVFRHGSIVRTEERCGRCHTAESGVRGHLVVDLRRDGIDRELADHRVQATLTVAVTFIVGMLTIVLVLRRSVERPLRRLALATRQIEGGDLTVHLPTEGADELAAVSGGFNTMVERLAGQRDMLEAEVVARTVEVHVLHASVREMHTRLMRTDRLANLGEMAAAVAHEVRTPLNALALNLHLVRRQLASAGLPSSEADIIAGEITRIDAVINRFLAVARFPALQVDQIELNPIVETVLDLLEPEARRASVELVRQLAEPSAVIRGDADRLRQVLINLILNGIQAMPDGGRIRVTTSATTQPVLEVADTGPGVPEVLREQILRPFFSTRGGTGLGLAICARLLKDQGGALRYVAREGAGAIFAVDLPLQEGRPS